MTLSYLRFQFLVHVQANINIFADRHSKSLIFLVEIHTFLNSKKYVFLHNFIFVVSRKGIHTF